MKIYPDHSACAYCGGAYDLDDHMVPKRRGGGDGIENKVPCCRSCNAAKGNRTPLEWYAGIKFDYQSMTHKIGHRKKRPRYETEKVVAKFGHRALSHRRVYSGTFHDAFKHSFLSLPGGIEKIIRDRFEAQASYVQATPKFLDGLLTALGRPRGESLEA